MPQTATITSKLQLTLPIRIAKKVGIKTGEKVHVSDEDGRIVITPIKNLVEELAGSLTLPKKWKRKDLTTIIQEAKIAYFGNKK